MKINAQDVRHVAALARLQFDDNEITLFTRQLNDILGYFEKLQEVDTTGVAPSTHAVSVRNAFRDDIPQTSLTQETSLENAPDSEQSCFRVPRILEV